MAVQITIIGLGEIGTSLGLALKYQKSDIKRIGCDIRQYAEKNAVQVEAVDEIKHGVLDAIEDSDIVFLAIPAHEMEATLQLIGPEIKKGAAVLDCSPIKVRALSWAREYLDQPDHFLGIYPTINANWLSERSNEHHTAHEDLFKTGTFFIAPAVDTEPSVVKLGADLALLVGAHSIYIEPEELDGLIAFNETLPNLLSSAYFSSATRLNSWQEVRKLGGKPFVGLTETISAPRTAKQFAVETMENRDNTLHAIHHLTQTLKAYRDVLQNQDSAALQGLYEENLKERERWLKDYSDAKWRKDQEESIKPPSMSDYLGQMFLGGLARKKKE